MSYTQTQLDALRGILASGTLRVKYDDKDITYQSVEHLIDAIRVVEAGLNTASPRLTHMNPTYSKGT